MNFFLTLAGILWVYMTCWFVLSLIKKRNDLADVAWGLGFVVMTWSAVVLSGEVHMRSGVVATLVTIWGVRLAWHIHRRNRGKAEDYRYAQWRKDWGKWFVLRSYAQVYMLQGVLLYCIALPVFVITHGSGEGVEVVDLVGLMIWCIGFYFETVGDAQLARFLNDPQQKGKLMQSGLWQYTRHPNYFGEVTQWWGIWLMAISVPFGFMSIVGPLTITVLILKVSGVPMLEKKMREHPDFAEYARRVSVFFPLPPKQ
jgi:steroid 5-alpha reductase family enzyme